MRKLIIVLLILTSLMALTACKEKEDSVEVVLNPGLDTVEIQTTWLDAGIKISSGNDEVLFYTDTLVDTSSLGVIDVLYEAEYKGKTYTLTRYVTVTDQTNPVLTLYEGIDTVQVGTMWIDTGCSVVDNSLEVLICTTSDTVDTNTAGDYEVMYTATDSSGNIGYIVRIVTVID